MTVNERSGTELDGGEYDDLCACDPAVVYGDDGYWYMLYGSNNKKNGYQYDSLMSMKDPYPLVIYLARARFVQGPYFKYTDKGWEDEIYDDELKIYWHNRELYNKHKQYQNKQINQAKETRKHDYQGE